MVNPAFTRLFGYTTEQVAGAPSALFYASDDEYQRLACLVDGLSESETGVFDAVFRRASGELFEGQLTLCFLSDDAGGFLGFMGIVRDMTAEKAVEAARRQTEERMRRLAESAFEALVITEDGRIIDANPAAARMFGYTVEEAIGLPIGAFLAVEFAPRVIHQPEMDAHEVLVVRKDGSRFWAEVQGRTWREGDRLLRVTAIRDLTARKTAEEAQRRADERWRRLSSAAFEGIIISEDDEILDANEQAAAIFGYTLDEMLGREPWHFVAPDYQEQVRTAVAQHLPGPYEVEAVRKDGSRFWIEFQARMWDEAGRLLRLTAVRDVTARREVEQALRDGELRWRSVMESLQDVYFECTLDDVLVYQSPAVERLYGRPASDLTGTPTRDLYVDKSRHDELVAILQSGRPVQDFEAEFYTATGTVHVSINCKFMLDEHHRAVGVNGTVRDISERKKAEQALRESEQRYRTIIETANEGICLLDPDGTITFANPSLCEMIGYSPEEVIGAKSSDFIAPEWQQTRLSHRELGWQAGISERFECLYVRKDGSRLWALVSASPLEREDGQFAALVMLTDITERRRSEERLALHIRHTPMAIIQWDTDFCVSEWNPAAERMFGYRHEEVHGRHAADIILTPRGRATAIEGWQRLLSAPAPLYEMTENLTRDGRTITCEWFHTPLIDDTGKVIGMASMAQDITETQRIARERDSILELSIDMLGVFSGQGEIRRVNPAWERTLGYKEHELLGTNVFALTHPDDRDPAVREALRAWEGEAVIDLRARMRCKDGSWKWLSWNVSPTQEDTTYAVARDISALVKAEEEQVLLMAALEENARVLAQQASELDRLRIEAEHLATFDTLTGVRNRRAWFADAARGEFSAVAVFDIDNFKEINDTFGHPVGDVVLQAVAARLAVEVEPFAVLGRIGGEEFAAAFHVPLHEARAVSERAVEAIAAEPVSIGAGHHLPVSISGGLAPRRDRGSASSARLQETYEEADVALYEAKAAGRRRLVVRGPRAA